MTFQKNNWISDDDDEDEEDVKSRLIKVLQCTPDEKNKIVDLVSDDEMQTEETLDDNSVDYEERSMPASDDQIVERTTRPPDKDLSSSCCVPEVDVKVEDDASTVDGADATERTSMLDDADLLLFNKSGDNFDSESTKTVIHRPIQCVELDSDDSSSDELSDQPEDYNIGAADVNLNCVKKVSKSVIVDKTKKKRKKEASVSYDSESMEKRSKISDELIEGLVGQSINDELNKRAKQFDKDLIELENSAEEEIAYDIDTEMNVAETCDKVFSSSETGTKVIYSETPDILPRSQTNAKPNTPTPPPTPPLNIVDDDIQVPFMFRNPKSKLNKRPVVAQQESGSNTEIVPREERPPVVQINYKDTCPQTGEGGFLLSLQLPHVGEREKTYAGDDLNMNKSAKNTGENGYLPQMLTHKRPRPSRDRVIHRPRNPNIVAFSKTACSKKLLANGDAANMNQSEQLATISVLGMNKTFKVSVPAASKHNLQLVNQEPIAPSTKPLSSMNQWPKNSQPTGTPCAISFSKMADYCSDIADSSKKQTKSDTSTQYGEKKISATTKQLIIKEHNFPSSRSTSQVINAGPTTNDSNRITPNYNGIAILEKHSDLLTTALNSNDMGDAPDDKYVRGFYSSLERKRAQVQQEFNCEKAKELRNYIAKLDYMIQNNSPDLEKTKKSFVQFSKALFINREVSTDALKSFLLRNFYDISTKNRTLKSNSSYRKTVHLSQTHGSSSPPENKNLKRDKSLSPTSLVNEKSHESTNALHNEPHGQSPSAMPLNTSNLKPLVPGQPQPFQQNCELTVTEKPCTPTQTTAIGTELQWPPTPTTSSSSSGTIGSGLQHSFAGTSNNQVTAKGDPRQLNPENAIFSKPQGQSPQITPSNSSSYGQFGSGQPQSFSATSNDRITSTGEPRYLKLFSALNSYPQCQSSRSTHTSNCEQTGSAEPLPFGGTANHGPTVTRQPHSSSLSNSSSLMLQGQRPQITPSNTSNYEQMGSDQSQSFAVTANSGPTVTRQPILSSLSNPSNLAPQGQRPQTTPSNTSIYGQVGSGEPQSFANTTVTRQPYLSVVNNPRLPVPHGQRSQTNSSYYKKMGPGHPQQSAETDNRGPTVKRQPDPSTLSNLRPLVPKGQRPMSKLSNTSKYRQIMSGQSQSFADTANRGQTVTRQTGPSTLTNRSVVPQGQEMLNTSSHISDSAQIGPSQSLPFAGQSSLFTGTSNFGLAVTGQPSTLSNAFNVWPQGQSQPTPSSNTSNYGQIASGQSPLFRGNSNYGPAVTGQPCPPTVTTTTNLRLIRPSGPKMPVWTTQLSTPVNIQTALTQQFQGQPGQAAPSYNQPTGIPSIGLNYGYSGNQHFNNLQGQPHLQFMNSNEQLMFHTITNVTYQSQFQQ